MKRKYERRLDEVERKSGSKPVRVVVSWGNAEDPEPKDDDEVIYLSWGDDDEMTLRTLGGTRPDK